MSGKRISRIEKMGVVPTYDLQVFGKEHNFLLGNGVISHNSGKSYTDMRWAENIDPNFTVEKNVITDPVRFAEICEDPVGNGFPPGSIIVLEEIGVIANATDFQSHINKGLSKIAQTMRHDRLGVFLNCPSLKQADLNFRRLQHAVLEMTSDPSNGFTHARFHINKANPIEGTYFLCPLVVKNQDTGEEAELGIIDTPKPSPHHCKAYEDMSRPYKRSIAGEMKTMMMQSRVKAAKKQSKLDGTDVDGEEFLDDRKMKLSPKAQALLDRAGSL